MEVKIAQDESNLENISVKNRPMNVAEEYLMFNSDEWLDAKTALDDHMDDTSQEAETVKIKLLNDILLVFFNNFFCNSFLQVIIMHNIFIQIKSYPIKIHIPKLGPQAVYEDIY